MRKPEDLLGTVPPFLSGERLFGEYLDCWVEGREPGRIIVEWERKPCGDTRLEEEKPAPMQS